MPTSYRRLILGTLTAALVVTTASWSGLGLRTGPKPSDLAFEHLRQRLRSFQTLRVWTTNPWASQYKITPPEPVVTADRDKGILYDSGLPRYLFDGLHAYSCSSFLGPIQPKLGYDALVAEVWEAIRTGFDNLVVTDENPYDAGLLVRPTERTGVAWRKLTLPDRPEVGAYLAFDGYAEPTEILTFGWATQKIEIQYVEFDLEIEEGYLVVDDADRKPASAAAEPLTICWDSIVSGVTMRSMVSMKRDLLERRRRKRKYEPPLYDLSTEE